MNGNKELSSGGASTGTGGIKPPRNVRRYSESPRNRRFRRGGGKRHRRQAPKARFEGATADFKSNYFDTNNNQSEQYNKTIKAICEYVGITYKNGADVRVSIEQLTIVDIVIPEEPIDASSLEKIIWEKEVENGVRRRSLLKTI